MSPENSSRRLGFRRDSGLVAEILLVGTGWFAGLGGSLLLAERSFEQFEARSYPNGVLLSLTALCLGAIASDSAYRLSRDALLRRRARRPADR